MDERYCTDLCVLAPLPIFSSFLSITFLNIAVMPKCAEMLGRSNRNLHQSFLRGGPSRCILPSLLHGLVIVACQMQEYFPNQNLVLS